MYDIPNSAPHDRPRGITVRPHAERAIHLGFGSEAGIVALCEGEPDEDAAGRGEAGGVRPARRKLEDVMWAAGGA